MKLAACLFAVMMLGACSDDDGKDSEAPVKCDSFVEALCTKLRSCFTEDPTTQADCVGMVKQTIPCSKALGVSKSYDACMSQTRAVSCTLVRMEDYDGPADCDEVILFDQKTLDQIKNSN